MRAPTFARKRTIDSEGTQRIYCFPNGYGASVIRNIFSYGHEDGLWELAVIRFTNEDPLRWTLCYDTPIADDVLGWLTDEDVDELLTKIENLAEAPT